MQTVNDLAKAILGELDRTLAAVSDEKARELVELILSADKVLTAGAGRSGLAIKAFTMRLMHMGLDAYVVGETVTPNLTDRDLLIIGSGSGATGSLVVMADKAHAIGARIALITIDDQSPIAGLADVVLAIPAPSEKLRRELGFTSIQPMGSLFEQSLLLVLDAVVLMLMAKSGKDSGRMFERHANLE